MTENNKKILLVLLPFWDPQVPPLGISCLKSFLNNHGYPINTADANTREEFRELLRNYFETVKSLLPEDRTRHIYNIGHDLLKNHLMAHLNHTDKAQYIKLLGLLIYNTYFYQLDNVQLNNLIDLAKQFFQRLELYLIDLLEQEKPEILGISVYGGTLAASLFAFKLAKQKYPNIKTVMGGGIFSGELAMDSPNFDLFLKRSQYIDKIFVGEGELLFLEYLNNRLPDTKKVFNLSDINHSLLDLDTLETPDFTGLDMEYYVQLAAYTSRSCPFQCSFCVETTYWGKYRKKSPHRIVEELTFLYHKYGSQLFLMCDSLLNPVVGGISDEFIQSGISLYWGGYLRAGQEVSNIDNTLKWRQGGFYRARLGVESGSQRILDLMGKKITISQIKSSISALAHAGIKTTTYWVIGYPGETEEDFQMTLDLIEELKDDIYEADCNPFWYFLKGQVNSEDWQVNHKIKRLYPENAKEMLITETWIIDGEPSREKTYQRVNRFIQHCSILGIPNPYSLRDIHKADERWKELQPNAVPSLIEFTPGGEYIDENKRVKKINLAQNILDDDDDWF